MHVFINGVGDLEVDGNKCTYSGSDGSEIIGIVEGSEIHLVHLYEGESAPMTCSLTLA